MQKVLFCDLGNVLLFFDLFKSINKFLAMGTQPAEKVLPTLFCSKFIEDIELGNVSPKVFFDRCCELFGMKLTYDEFYSIWTNIFIENLAMTRWIKDISAGHRVYLVSNINYFHYKAVRERYDFFRHVTGCVASHEVGLRKPDPRIFIRALNMAGVTARQVFFLDDVREHVDAAQRCGIHAHRYVSPDQARQSWQKFLKHPIL